MSERDAPAESLSSDYDTFDDFLKGAIRAYYERGFAQRKGNFIALIIASGQMLSLAKDSLSGEDGLKRIAVGTAAAVALRVGLRFALGGPLGMLVTGLSLASMVAFLAKNQKEITGRVPRYRELIDRSRERFEEIQAGYRGNRYGLDERNLLVDGLQKRFLGDCDAI